MGAPEVGDCGCDGVLNHVWSYLDHESDPPTCAELEAHLRTCTYCQGLVQFNEQLKKLVRRCADPGPAPAAASAQLRARVQAIIKVRRTLS
ncbi:MAG TPA: zf-HC2 domain-containing protein [Actinomycetota bacterium]